MKELRSKRNRRKIRFRLLMLLGKTLLLSWRLRLKLIKKSN